MSFGAPDDSVGTSSASACPERWIWVHADVMNVTNGTRCMLLPDPTGTVASAGSVWPRPLTFLHALTAAAGSNDGTMASSSACLGVLPLAGQARVASCVQQARKARSAP